VLEAGELAGIAHLDQLTDEIGCAGGEPSREIATLEARAPSAGVHFGVMTSEERAQLIEDIDRSAGMRQRIVDQARLSKSFDLVAAWEELDQFDASISARIKKGRVQQNR
jgi:hypothetical protein